MTVAEIKIGRRHRRDLGDVRSLAKSIQAVGLLHPVVVDRSGALIAGERRLRAFELLGRSDIPVRVVDLEEIVRGELAENAERKDFLPSEIEAIRRAMAPMIATPSGRPPTQKVETFHNNGAGKTRDKIGAFAGVSGRTVEKIAKVVAAAEAEPERFGHLVTEMDRTGKVTPALRKLRMSNDEERIKGLAIAPGRYRALIVDPPWRYDCGLSIAGRAAPGYATMTHEELLALPIESLAEANCHLYLWTINNFMPRACELLGHWGFQYKTMLTWVKPRWGLGSYFRNQTEHVLFGVRGELRTRSDSISTVFEAPTGEHSEKPEAFYDIVRGASYGPFGEVFQRKARPDFRNVYVSSNEAEA
jgi:N6-adenosine-specific RNA methylase IME4